MVSYLSSTIKQDGEKYITKILSESTPHSNEVNLQFTEFLAKMIMKMCLCITMNYWKN